MKSMHPFTIFWTVIGLILLWLAAIPAYRQKSFVRFLLDVFLSAVGIFSPLFIFLMSGLLLPDWKGECKHGWLDCFHMGKYALTPLVLWASAAFYVVQIVRPDAPPKRWVRLGLFIGAITSLSCLIIGLAIHDLTDEFSLWLLVPFYTFVWYLILSIRAIRLSALKPNDYLGVIGGSIPFWIATIIWSKKYYQTLPDTPPTCFVVTAAQSGHEFIVGPFLNIERNGKDRLVNTQLITFWEFERIWALRYPRFHKRFRTFYNQLGPAIASRIQSRSVADIVYLILKPLEFLAAIVVLKNGEQES